jgi:phosphoglycolate phosphatase
LPENDLRELIGPPMQEVFLTITGGNTELVSAAIAAYRARYSTIGLFENVVYPGIPEALTTLAQSHKLYVCTSKPTTFSVRILEHFDLAKHFAAIYGCELDGTRADKRELMRYLLDRERIDPTTAAMIGDRKFDVAAALANAVTPYGVLWGHGTADELRAAGAVALIKTPHELPTLFAPVS